MSETALLVEAILAACPQLHPAQARMAALNVEKVNARGPAIELASCIERLNLEAGEIVLVRLREHVTAEIATLIREHLAEALPDSTAVIVLIGDGDITGMIATVEAAAEAAYEQERLHGEPPWLRASRQVKDDHRAVARVSLRAAFGLDRERGERL